MSQFISATVHYVTLLFLFGLLLPFETSAFAVGRSCVTAVKVSEVDGTDYQQFISNKVTTLK